MFKANKSLFYSIRNSFTEIPVSFIYTALIFFSSYYSGSSFILSVVKNQFVKPYFLSTVIPGQLSVRNGEAGRPSSL